MPFVMLPCLWNQFSYRFRKSGAPRERSHGDGVLVSFDSPEALEEVIWSAFWRGHYQPKWIVPWNADIDEDGFDRFLRNHMRKIILQRCGEDPAARYASKNNLNIARTGLLRRLFPAAAMVVPFRQPLQHAASLLNQHRNFLEIHRHDRFGSVYMKAIGHFDFGENLRPIDFNHWLSAPCPEVPADHHDPHSLAFWLRYWIVTYQHLLDGPDNGIALVNYDSLCGDARHALEQLAASVQCDPEQLLAAAQKVRRARPYEVPVRDTCVSLLDQAEKLHARLKNASIC
jgi:hypothetical protein